ncbi:MAG: hypothetical protein HY699_24335 [Deltaproteobacteria bacterium]|nr:hypothetical protein [Deltaproteobacteria bacterium]
MSFHVALPQLALAALGLASSLVVPGCAGDGPAPANSATGLAAIQREIFNPSCVAGGCHNGVARAGNLVLTDGDAYQQLLAAPTVNAAAQAAGLARVQPFQPEASFLLIKLTNPRPGEGSRMPLSAAPLAEDKIEMVRQWIAAGAPEGATPAPTASPAATLPSPTVTPAPTTIETSPPTPTATPVWNADATLANLQTRIFTPDCARAFCHTAIDQAGELVLEEGHSFEQLVGIGASNFAAKQAGLVRVQPGDPEHSFLLIKVAGPDPSQGSGMPLGGDALAADKIELMHAWIRQGAQP